MALLDDIASGTNGYYRTGDEEEFPWDYRGSSVWYALFVVEENKIQKYGFTASKTQKKKLLKSLEKVSGLTDSLLIGVWTGNYRTDLFVLKIEEAIKRFKNPDNL